MSQAPDAPSVSPWPVTPKTAAAAAAAPATALTPGLPPVPPVALELSAQTLERFAREAAKYPPEQRQSAVMGCLAILQQERGWVAPEGELAVANYLGMPPMAVHEVSTFYNMFNHHPVGRFKITVCTNLPCQLRGGQGALAALEKKLGITDGQTTPDGLFTLEHCECLGACGDAPVLLVNDRAMCSFMDEARLESLIEGLKSEAGADAQAQAKSAVGSAAGKDGGAS